MENVMMENHYFNAQIVDLCTIIGFIFSILTFIYGVSQNKKRKKKEYVNFENAETLKSDPLKTNSAIERTPARRKK
jgi:hypothetical protein